MFRLARIAVLSLVVALAVAPAALARGGGSTSGGGGTGGGGTGGGGGTNSGGVNDTGTSTPAPSCATLPSATAPVGYYSTWAAVWNTFTVRSCSTRNETVNVRITNGNQLTGAIDYDVTGAYVLSPGQNLSSVYDNDFAPFSTPYDVSFVATDASTGAVLATATTTATTPPAR